MCYTILKNKENHYILVNVKQFIYDVNDSTGLHKLEISKKYIRYDGVITNHQTFHVVVAKKSFRRLETADSPESMVHIGTNADTQWHFDPSTASWGTQNLVMKRFFFS